MLKLHHLVLCTALLGHPATSFAKNIAPILHPEQKGMKALNVVYDFARMKDADFADRNQLALKFNSLPTREGLNARLIIEDLQNRRNDMRQTAEIELGPKGTATIQLHELREHRFYRIWITLHRADGEASRANALGYVRIPFYLMSWSPDRDLEKRRLAVTDALEHYYLAKLGKAGNMDCWQFTKRYLGPFFPGWNKPNTTGKSLASLAAQGTIAADYVRIPDYHSLILVARDTAGTVWSIEGNFNNTIEVTTRNDYAHWRVTHHP
jgi:hypothetical protein